MSRERRSSVEGDSEIESKIVTVGSNQGYRALMIAVVVFLIGGVYYLYFNPYIKDVSEIINNEEIKQDIQELKEKLEQVPHDGIVSERVITDILPPLPPIPVPQVIPEVKQIRKEEVKKREEQSKEAHLSNVPVLPKQNFPSGSATSNLPTSFPTIGGGTYPRDRRSAQMLAILGSSVEGKATDAILSSDISSRSGKATRIGKLGLMIIQGKVIDAILETAISSDLQGMLRAIISRDVYAETGNTVLIPRGSRLIGAYSLDLSVAKARVNINWNRIILPHGIDVAVSLSGIDELGRVGVAGIVDNKIASALFSSIALTAVSIGSAVVGDKASNVVDALTVMDLAKSIIGSELDVFSLKELIINRLKEGPVRTAIGSIKKEEWKLGPRAIGRIKGASDEKNLSEILKEEVAQVLSTALVGEKITGENIPITLEDIKVLLKIMQKKGKSIYKNAIEKSINDFSKDMRDIVDRSVDKKPTTYVDQGTALKVFVNQDIVFPPQSILNN